MSSQLSTRRFVLDRHMKNRADARRSKPADYITLNPDTWRQEPNSHLPLVELTPENQISLSEASKGGVFVHKGKFLLCRSIAPSYVKSDILYLVVEDSEGQQALPLVLSNFTYSLSMFGVPSSDSKIKTVVPVGTIVALMNPFFAEVEGLSSGGLALSCKNPRHFVILGKHHPLLSDNTVVWKADLPYPSEVASDSYDDLEAKDAGIKYFNEKNYAMAYECFAKALKMSDSENMGRQYSNLSITCLYLGKFNLALEKAERGLEVDSKNVKLIYRKAKSLFLLRRYDECLQFLKTQEGDLKEEEEFKQLLRNAEICCQESKLGKYDWFTIAQEAEAEPFLEGHADYFPEHLLEIRHGSPEEQGIFAKEDIPSGQVVLACEAFAFHIPEIAASRNTMQHFAVCGKLGVSKIINAKLAVNPSLLEELVQLNGETEFPGVPECVDPDKSVFEEAFRIHNIAVSNTMMSLDVKSCSFKGTGLWVLPKLISHTCVDINVIRHYMGNFIFLRSVREIKKGERLAYSFIGFSDIENGLERMESIKRSYGRPCPCRLCEMDAADSTEKQNAAANLFEKFLKQQQRQQMTRSFNSAELKKMLDEAEALRPDKSLNVLATRIRSALGWALLAEDRKIEAAKQLEEAMWQYENLGLVCNAFNSIEMISSWHPDPIKASWFAEKAKNYLKIIFGDERILTLGE